MKIKGNIENKGKGGKGWWLEGVVAKGGGGGQQQFLRETFKRRALCLFQNIPRAN